jgi:hypothetical protein
MSFLSGSIDILHCAFVACGKPFQKNGHQRYCNHRCAQADYMRGLRKKKAPVYEERTCKLCGDPFSPKRSNQVFCHTDCQSVFFNAERIKTVKETKNCVKCGKPFIAYGSHDTYCTTECRLVPASVIAPLPKRRCRHCRKTFRPVKKGNYYCKRQCYRNHYGRGLQLPKERKCRQCEAVFAPKRANNWFCKPEHAHDYHNTKHSAARRALNYQAAINGRITDAPVYTEVSHYQMNTSQPPCISSLSP